MTNPTDSKYLISTWGGVPGPPLIEPYPTPFKEFEIVGTRGDGGPVPMGFPSCEWHFENQPIETDDWSYFINLCNKDGGAWGDVSLRTATNETESDAEVGRTIYKFRTYRAKMHRPTGDRLWGYRYVNVVIRFTHLSGV